MLAAPLLVGAAPPAKLSVEVEGLRSADGRLLLCLTRDSTAFPDCSADPHAIRSTTDAGEAGKLSFANLASGNYALSVIHDENGNGRLDTLLAIPREGFGFSRNPRIRFGPPRFAEARFALAAGDNRQAVRVRYLL